jgi:hypothetical protein
MHTYIIINADLGLTVIIHSEEEIGEVEILDQLIEKEIENYAKERVS